jgi:hypothetical protein
MEDITLRDVGLLPLMFWRLVTLSLESSSSRGRLMFDKILTANFSLSIWDIESLGVIPSVSPTASPSALLI